MSKQRYSRTEYDAYYGVDSNAALQPQFAPRPQPQKKPQHKSRVAEEKKLRKQQWAVFAASTMLALSVCAALFLVLSRSAAIYQNNIEIRKLAARKTSIETSINTVKKQMAEGGDLNAYFELAENELALSYPDGNQIITVACNGAPEDEAVSDEESNSSLFDDAIDWLSSLERRFKNWG